MYEINSDDAFKIMMSRNDHEILLPLYVIIGDEKFSLLDIDTIENCSRGLFKVGFVTGVSLFKRNNFPENRLFEFDNQRVFTQFDIDKNIEYRCYVLETGRLIATKPNDMLVKEVNTWIDMLLERIMKNVEKIKKERIKRIMEELS